MSSTSFARVIISSTQGIKVVYIDYSIFSLLSQYATLHLNGVSSTTPWHIQSPTTKTLDLTQVSWISIWIWGSVFDLACCIQSRVPSVRKSWFLTPIVPVEFNGFFIYSTLNNIVSAPVITYDLIAFVCPKINAVFLVRRYNCSLLKILEPRHVTKNVTYILNCIHNANFNITCKNTNVIALCYSGMCISKS